MANSLKRIYKSPLLWATLLAVFSGAIGIRLGFSAPENLQKALFNGAVALIFGGLLTAVVKLLVENHQRKRDEAADRTRFISNVLSDLKSVYDRVERARIVISAHRSALTYGKEMRDLIDSRVQLRNVLRALKDEKELSGVHEHVRKMESYLERLTKVFESIYLGVSIAQEVHEAKKKRIVEDDTKEADEIKSLKNEAWPKIAKELDKLGFIRDRESKTPFTNDYEKEFEKPLDLATCLLRDKLRGPAGPKKGSPEQEKPHGGSEESG